MKFGEYLPDLPDRDNPGLTVAKNCLPHAVSYKQFSGPVVYSNALSARARGYISCKDTSGNVYNFAATDDRIYSLSGNTYSEVMRTFTGSVTFTNPDTMSAAAGLDIFLDTWKVEVSGASTAANNTDHTLSGNATATTITTTGTPAITTEGPTADVTITRRYTTADDDNWEFVKWGSTVIGVNGFTDPPQAMTLGGTYFADLSGSPPKAKHICIAGEQVFLGNINDGSSKPNVIHFSASGSSTGWTAGTSQSDTRELQEGGQIQKLVGGEYVVCLCESAIYRGIYEGYPGLWGFYAVDRNRGTPSPGSVTNFGNRVFYLGCDGFYMFDGTQSIPIGANKVDKTFYADLDQTYFDRISSAIDPINQIVLWAYPGSGNAYGQCNKIIAYNWSVNKWSGPIETETEIIMSALSSGWTLDSIGASYTDLDALPYSLDSRVWQGGSLLLSCFNSDHKHCNFTGDSLTATFTTGEFMLTEGMRSHVSGIRPLFDGSGSSTVRVGSRNVVNDSVSWTQVQSPNSRTGLCNFRSNARYHRFEMTIQDGFAHAYGADIEAVQSGKT